MYKRSLIRVLLILSGVFLMGCSTDFETEFGGSTLPVVYSLIDPQDSVHYLRLSRTFKGGDNAFLSARNPDSVAFRDAVVKLEFYTEQGWKYNEFQFEPVLPFDKAEGIFTNLGDQLFKLEKNLFDRFIPGTHLLLNMNIPGYQMISSSYVEHLRPTRITAPRKGLMTYISLYPPNPIKVHFEDLKHFTNYELHVRLNYTNVFSDGSEETAFAEKRYLRKSSNTNPNRTSEIIVTIAGDNLFAAIQQDIPKNPEVKYRRIGDIDFWVFTGSPVFNEYQELNKYASDNAGTPVTNIVNGTGIFALKYHDVRSGYILDNTSKDSLINGRFTKELGFIKW